MEVRSKSRLARACVSATLGVIVGAGTALVSASPALAAAWHPISGETYSNTNWYCSANVRTKVNTGDVEAYFNYLPSPVRGGIRFGVANWQNCSLLDYSDFTITGNSQDIGYLQNNTQFKNIFRRNQTCQTGCVHTFGGAEYY